MTDYVKEVNATPLPRDLFLELVQAALDAMRGKRRAIPPAAERCLEDAPPGALYLTDCPENQMGMSIVGECKRRFAGKRGEAVAQSFVFRWFAIHNAKDAGQLDEFIQYGKGDHHTDLVHTAIFEAAAECPLDPEGDFDGSYVGRIRAIKASEDEMESGG